MRIGHGDHGCLLHLQCPFHDQVDDPFRLGILDSLTCSHRGFFVFGHSNRQTLQPCTWGRFRLSSNRPTSALWENCKLSEWKHRGASSSLMRLRMTTAGDWTKKLRTKRKPGPEDRIHT